MPRMFAASRGPKTSARSASFECAEYLTMNRYSNTFLYDYRRLVSQGFAGFQSVSDAFLGFLFAAEGDKSFALEIEDILFADQLRRGQRPACKDVREFATHVCVVLRGVAAAEHHMDSELRSDKKWFAENFDLRRLRTFLPACRERLVAAAHKRQRSFLGVGNQSVAVHGDTIFPAQISQVAAFLSAGAHLGHSDGFEDGLQRVEKIQVGFRRRGQAKARPTGVLVRADQHFLRAAAARN